LPLALPDEWEEYRPQEINNNTLTIWFGHKNRFLPLLALPDDPNFSQDLRNPQTAKYDYNARLDITDYIVERAAGGFLESYLLPIPAQCSTTPALGASDILSCDWRKQFDEMGFTAEKGTFLGEEAVFIIGKNGERTCQAVRINAFIIGGDVLFYTTLSPRNTPIHSAVCEVTKTSHQWITYCKCQYCRPHPRCSTLEKEGLVHSEKVRPLLEYVFSEIRKRLTSKNPTQEAWDIRNEGASYSEYDCSKLTRTIYPFLPRTAREQYDYFKNRGAIISSRYDLHEGDLIFFKDGAEQIKHVGYVVSNIDGNIQFIHSTAKKGVRDFDWNTTGPEGNKNKYGELNFAGGGRP